MAIKACLLVLAFASAAMAQGYDGPLSEPRYTLRNNIQIDNEGDRNTINSKVNFNNSISPRVYFEWQSYDGWFNNPAHPDWGGAGELDCPNAHYRKLMLEKRQKINTGCLGALFEVKKISLDLNWCLL